MSPLYTRGGDGGETGLLVGGRLSKADPRVESYGTVDELNATVGAARVAVMELPAGADRDFLQATLDLVQDGLMRLAADLASGGQAGIGVGAGDVAGLETRIDEAVSRVPPLTRFLVPGVSRAEAAMHVARTVSRRAERRVVALGDSWGDPGDRVRFLNRISDLLFALSRVCLKAEGKAERVWEGRPTP